ncbi:MAG: hypothetical protein ACM33T_05920 [Solirubrobacterales bacterium]
MQPVTATPAHLLMQHTQRSNDHLKRDDEGAASTFASYAFGPMQMPDAKAQGKDRQPEGAPMKGNPLGATSMAWVTTVQGVDGDASGGKAGV